MGKERKSAAAQVLPALAILLVMLGAYVVAYLALLEIRYPERFIINESTGQIIVFGHGLQTTSSYHLGGEAAETFFSPAEAVDRKLRPKTWDPLKALTDSGAWP